ncbi:MAG: hypothetical protein V1494_06660 [Candidatus Diapherotrites archaeon]
MRLNKKGSLFSFDFFCAFFLLAVMLLLMFSALSSRAKAETDALQHFSLQRKGLTLMDSLVKNRNVEKPLLGSAYFDSSAKSIEANTVDYGLLKKAETQDIYLGEKTFLKELSIVSASGATETIIQNFSPSRECVSVERFVLLKKIPEEKALLRGVVCSEP